MRAFYLNDYTRRGVGYCFREGDKMVLVDTDSKVYESSLRTRAREAVKISLNHQRMIVRFKRLSYWKCDQGL